MLRQEKGQTTVEFALVAILLIGLLMTIFEFGVMFYVNQTIQHAVRDGARYAAAHRNETGLDLRTSMENKIKEQSMGLYAMNSYTTNSIHIYTLPSLTTIQTNTTGTEITDTGGPQALISVEYTYSWPLLTPIGKSIFKSKNGEYTFTVKTYILSEPTST